MYGSKKLAKMAENRKSALNGSGICEENVVAIVAIVCIFFMIAFPIAIKCWEWYQNSTNTITKAEVLSVSVSDSSMRVKSGRHNHKTVEAKQVSIQIKNLDDGEILVFTAKFSPNSSEYQKALKIKKGQIIEYKNWLPFWNYYHVVSESGSGG